MNAALQARHLPPSHIHHTLNAPFTAISPRRRRRRDVFSSSEERRRNAQFPRHGAIRAGETSRRPLPPYVRAVYAVRCVLFAPLFLPRPSSEGRTAIRMGRVRWGFRHGGVCAGGDVPFVRARVLQHIRVATVVRSRISAAALSAWAHHDARPRHRTRRSRTRPLLRPLPQALPTALTSYATPNCCTSSAPQSTRRTRGTAS